MPLRFAALTVPLSRVHSDNLHSVRHPVDKFMGCILTTLLRSSQKAFISCPHLSMLLELYSMRQAADAGSCGLQAALACGLKAEDLKQLIDEEAAHHEIHAGTLGQPWRKIPTMTPGPTELADRGRHDILSPQPIPRSQPAPAQAQPSKDETARPANEASAQTAQMGAEEGGGAMPGEGRAMSKSQLRKLAERRGLSYDLLLADAAAQGIELAD